MKIEIGAKVTKEGDSLTNPDVGTIEAISGQRARVNWGWVTAWETLRSLQVVETDCPAPAESVAAESTSDLPTLTGRPEIVKLANADRRDMLAQLDEQIRSTAGDAPADLVDALAALYREVMLRQTDSGWWLNNHAYAPGPIVQRLLTAEDKARIAALAAKRLDDDEFDPWADV